MSTVMCPTVLLCGRGARMPARLGALLLIIAFYKILHSLWICRAVEGVYARVYDGSQTPRALRRKGSWFMNPA